MNFMKKRLSFVLLLLVFCRGISFISAQVSGSTESVLARINELLSSSKYSEAIALFDTITPPDRDSSRVRLLKASVLSSAGKYADARTIVEAVSRAEPNNTEALFILAAIEAVSGRNTQQKTALEKIIKIQPDNTEALIALGDLSLRTRAAKAAASYFDRVLKKDPNNAGALLGLSRAFRMNKEWDNAEVLLNRAVDLYPSMAEARSERARYHWGRGNLKQALSDLDEAKKLAPNDYWIAVDRGNLLLELNRKPEALEEFSRAVRINPGEYTAYAYTSGLKDDLGDYDGAEMDYAVLAKLKPDYFYGLEGLGLHKMKDGKWAEAMDAFTEAYKQAPQEILYALLAAINWMRAEDIAKPRNYLSQVLNKAKRDTLEWYMLRLYYDLTVRNYVGENDMVIRLDQEKNQNLKARMLFYMAQYYDVRGNTALANKYFLLVSDLDIRSIPEWRLNEWIINDRNLKIN